MNTSTGLLSLPRELRDEIYSYTTSQTWDPQSTLRIIPASQSDGQQYFWPENSKWQPIHLLCVSHQMREEVLDFIDQQHKNGAVRAELDIRAKGYVYTPTWTYLNYALRPRDSLDLHVNLTIFSTEAFRRNDGWPRQPGQVFRALLNFLNRFIFKGPSFLASQAPFETPGPHFIKTFSVHVTFQDYYTLDTWPETVHEIFKMLKALSMLDTVHQYIGKIRATSTYTRREQEVGREAEWAVRRADATTPAIFREDDWSRIGFDFGKAWLERQQLPLSSRANAGEPMLDN